MNFFRRYNRTKPATKFLVITGAVFLVSLGVIFYAMNLFSREFLSAAESMGNLHIPKAERALIELDFGNGKKRLFMGVVQKEVYPLEVALQSAAESGKFTYEIRKGTIHTLANVGGISGKWRVYRNGESVDAPLVALTISRGDKYTFRFEKK